MRNDSRKWGTLVIACLAMLMLSVDLTVLHLAVPKLVEDLAPSATQQLWIADVYGFALAGLLVTMGNLGDRIGRRRLLLIGTAAFGAASLVTAYAPTPELLIAARALLGVAGATIMPSTLSLIRNVFTDSTERTTAVGIWSSIGAAGFALGPLVGGALLNEFFWGSVFLINLPVVAVILVAGLAVLPESRNPHPGRIDLVSVPLSFTGIVAVVYALKEAAHGGVGQTPVIAAAAVGVVTLAVFVRRQARLAEPLIDVRLFRNRAFSAAVGSTLVAMFAMIAMSLLFAQYFQLVLGWSPLAAGLAGLPGGVGAAIGGSAAAPLITRMGRARTVALGMALAAAGFALYSQVGLEVHYPYLAATMILTSTGIGLTFAVVNDTVIASAPRERAGAAAAISETASEMGGALGIAVLGTVLSSAYRGGLELPAGLPPGPPTRSATRSAARSPPPRRCPGSSPEPSPEPRGGRSSTLCRRPCSPGRASSPSSPWRPCSRCGACPRSSTRPPSPTTSEPGRRTGKGGRSADALSGRPRPSPGGTVRYAAPFGI